MKIGEDNKMFSKSECDGYGNICGQMVTTSLQLENCGKWIPLDEALKQYFDMHGISHETFDDALFHAYFLSFIELREIWFFATLRGAFKNNPNFPDGKIIYEIMTHSFTQVVKARYPMGIVEDNITSDALWDILQKNQFKMDDTMEDFFDFARSTFKIPEQKMCKAFFIAENKNFEELMIEGWKRFVAKPNEFKGKSGCMASFVTMALIIGVPVGSAMWLF